MFKKVGQMRVENTLNTGAQWMKQSDSGAAVSAGAEHVTWPGPSGPESVAVLCTCQACRKLSIFKCQVHCDF